MKRALVRQFDPAENALEAASRLNRNRTTSSSSELTRRATILLFTHGGRELLSQGDYDR